MKALTGQKDYFIPNHTYREEHDLLLIIRTLIDWAGENNRGDYAAEEFMKVFAGYIDQQKLSESLSLIHAYVLVVQDSRNELPVNCMQIVDMLKSLINAHAKLITQDEVLRNHIMAVATYLPELIKNTLTKPVHQTG